jgi:tetratricopeptide (TPR) repeat protein
MSNSTNFDDVVNPDDSPEAVKRLNFDGGLSMEVEDVRHGGMGVVYLGEMVGPDGKRFPVAAKTIRESLLLKPATRSAFQREASIWAQLSGAPFIQPLLRVEHRNGFPYLLTLRVVPDEDGVVSVRDLIRLGKDQLPPLKIFEIALAVATAMGRATKQLPDIVHGDIKPDNVLLLEGVPHLGDFGIAKAVGENEPRRGGLGTLAYLAPEAFSGSLTAKSGLYAYGCMLYECLSSSLPFGDEKDVEVMRARHEAANYPPLPLDTDDVLLNEMGKIAQHCMHSDPDERPEKFGVLAVNLYALGMEHAPNLVNRVSSYCELSGQLGKDPVSQRLVEVERVQNLLEAGDPAAAVRAAEQVPEETRLPELWLALGTAHSLSGNDERALECFDRCSSATTDEELLTRCASEKGLSLRRLERYDEAIALYEELITRADSKQLLTIMGNYVATLLDVGRTEDAVRQGRWLVEKERDRSEAWLLLGEALKASSDFEEALQCYHRAIDRNPNEVRALIRAAEIYQFEFGNLARALSLLDAAFATGEHEPLLISRLLSVNMLLDRREDVGGLLNALEQAPDEVGMRITRMAVDDVKKYMERFGEKNGKSADGTLGRVQTRSSYSIRRALNYLRQKFTLLFSGVMRRGSPNGNEKKGQAKAESPTKRDVDSQGGPDLSTKPVVLETAVLMREGEPLPMVGCRAFLRSEMFVVDFFDRSAGQDYAASFGSCFAKFTRQLVVQLGNLHLRNSMFGVARCTHCGFLILTNRAENEKLLCRMCDQKGPVEFDRSPSNSALVAACESAAGLKRHSVGGVLVLLSFWVPEGEPVETVRKLCEQDGWRLITKDTLSPSMATLLGRYYGASISGEPSLQMIRELPASEEKYEGTSWSVQRIILEVHSRVGRYPSSSIELPEGSAVYLEQNRQAVMRSIRAELEKQKDDPENLARLIRLVIDEDLIEAGRLVSLSRQLSSRDHPRLLAARGLYALSTGDTEEARRLFEQAKRQAPLDTTIRLDMIKMWQELGRGDKAEEEITELRAIGFHLKP